MTHAYFNTDGIRGAVGQLPITPDCILRLANALGSVLRATESKPTAVIGKDTRISGYMIESALQSGFSSAGVDVVQLGPMPTGGVAYLTRALRAHLGIVISASHNPYEDNGIKFFGPGGRKLPDAWEHEIEARLSEPPVWVDCASLGKASRLEDAAGRYIEFCKSTFCHGLTLRGLSIVIDAAHGAAYQIAPQVLHELGAEVSCIGCEPDGININHEVGATNPRALAAAVKEQGAAFGIALDGDADRVQIVDGTGRLYNGDELLYVIAKDRLDRGMRLPGVVGTLMTNMAVEAALIARGVDFVRTKVGDRYVLEELERRGWVLGGESCGHLVVLDKHTTGDGLISALQVFEAVTRTGRSLAESLQGVSLLPQAMINVAMKNRSNWKDNTSLAAEALRAQAELGSDGRILIRPSGTEPLLRIMVEARDETQARQTAERLAHSAHGAYLS